jgi:predicted KAP-like P-loop ATPase|tara:strand:+ start:279 stop:554 length:276 start_codon:yes stop_codon:yes gene_type:complete
MDNITMTDKQLNQLVDKLAGAMIKRIYGIEQKEARDKMSYYADDLNDEALGELARLMTLLNIYEDREEYEKCAAVKKHLDKVNKILDEYDA